MSGDQDPVQRAADDGVDLYDVASWDERTFLDGVSTWLHGALVRGARASVVALAVLILIAQFTTAIGLLVFDQPIVGMYVLLSVVPALGLAAYIWKVDVTMQEPLELLVGTFALGFLFAGFAAVVNSIFSGVFLNVGSDAPAWLAFLAPALFFFLVVAPVEESVKWLAVRLYAYRSDRFDAVVDGAVYGAMAGLGFATIENAVYVTREVVMVAQAAGGPAVTEIAVQTAAVRTLAGPGHVIYSAFAGYYLGLAKFNPENRGPIVVKGLLIAAIIHATYNTAVSNLNAIAVPLGIPVGAAFLGFVLVYDGVFFYALYRKISAYRDAYVQTDAGVEYDDGDTLEEGTADTAAVEDGSADGGAGAADASPAAAHSEDRAPESGPTSSVSDTDAADDS